MHFNTITLSTPIECPKKTKAPFQGIKKQYMLKSQVIVAKKVKCQSVSILLGGSATIFDHSKRQKLSKN